MKVIELLLQGKKVWDEYKKGYYFLENDRLYYHGLNKNGDISYEHIMMDLAMRKGEEYISKQEAYFISYNRELFRLESKYEKGDIITCGNINDCREDLDCDECVFGGHCNVKLDDRFEFHKIEY